MLYPPCPTPELRQFPSWLATMQAARVAPVLPYMCICGEHWHASSLRIKGDSAAPLDTLQGAAESVDG